MKPRYMIFESLLLLVPFFASAQPVGPWHHKKCAVCLTYDDALNVHLDNVVPLLDSLGFKATFYLAGFFPGFRERTTDWKAVAAKGHELGNHTLFHPCDGRGQGREWVPPDYDLSRYSVARMVDEIRMANVLLNTLDGKTQRTFAYPCGDMEAGDSSYRSLIRSDFVAARGVESRLEHLGTMDLSDIGCYMINGQSGDDLVGLVKQALKENALLVFLFHGVGGEHSINVSLEAHRELLHFLKDHEREIWVAPLSEIAAYAKAYRQ